MKKLVVVILVVAAGVAFAAYAGMFNPVKVAEGKSDRYVLVCKKMTGPFSQSPRAVREVREKLFLKGVEARQGFGIYLDDPKKVKEADLRWVAGCVIDAKDSKQAAKGGEYPVRVYGPVKAVIAEFPFRNRWNILAGVFKVYPAMGRLAKEKGYEAESVMEVYDMKAGRITYVMPVDPKFDALKAFYK
jgi:hypothetical protein